MLLGPSADAARPRAGFALVATLFFFSGAAGLVYQVLWMRSLGLFLGSDMYGVSIILSSFMGGLALGSLLGGRLAERIRRPLLAYGVAELGIGAIALPFATSLFFVAYAFSGWNAAAYAAEEFINPRRDVPRAMLIGCALVGVAYLLVNWILVANLTPERAQVVFEYEEARVTLGHLVVQDFLGSSGSSAMSIGIAIIMVSSTSAMLLVGPRVYAEMARDGFLPSWLRGVQGAPPRASVVLQGALAIGLLYLHTIGELLANVAGVLVFFSALVAVGLFRVKRHRPDLAAPRTGALIAAGVYAGFSAWMLYNAFEMQTGLIPWIVATCAAGLVAFAIARRRLS